MIRSMCTLALGIVIATLFGCENPATGPVSEPAKEAVRPNIRIYSLVFDKNDKTLRDLLTKSSQHDTLSEKKLAEMLSAGAIQRRQVTEKELQAGGIGISFSCGDQVLSLGAPKAKHDGGSFSPLRKQNMDYYPGWMDMWPSWHGFPEQPTANAAGGMSIYPSQAFNRIEFYFIFEELWPGQNMIAYSVESEEAGDFSAWGEMNCPNGGPNPYRLRIGYLVNHPADWGWWSVSGWSYAYATMPVEEYTGD